MERRKLKISSDCLFIRKKDKIVFLLSTYFFNLDESPYFVNFHFFCILIFPVTELHFFSQHLACYIRGKMFYGIIDFRVPANQKRNLVSYIKVTFFPQILYPVDQFPGNAFFFQFLRYIDIQCYGQAAFIGNQPARNVFRKNFHIFQPQYNTFSPMCNS